MILKIKHKNRFRSLTGISPVPDEIDSSELDKVMLQTVWKLGIVRYK